MLDRPDQRDPSKAREIRPVLMLSPMLVGRGSGFADLTPHVAPVSEESPVVVSQKKDDETNPKEERTEQDSPATVSASPSDLGTSENGSQQIEKDLHPSTQSANPMETVPAARAPLLMPPLT